MEEMCINTYDDMVPGDICSGDITGERGIVPCAFRVIAQITKEEYIDFVRQKNLLHRIKRSIHDPKLKFFRVRILD